LGGTLTKIDRRTLLDLTDDYIMQWRRVKWQQSRIVDTNFLPLTNTLRKTYRIRIQDTLREMAESPFVHLLNTNYERDLKHIFRMLNEPHGTSTKLNPGLETLYAEYKSPESLFDLHVMYVIAAAIQVSAQPELYSRHASETGLLKEVMPNKDVVKHARALHHSINKQGLKLIDDLMPRLIDLANGGQQQYELEVVSKISEVAVREIVLITKHAFLVTNNRSEGRFSTSAIERILELVFDLGYLEKPIKYRQISNLQRKYGDDESDPLTDNQIDVIF
jgi:hypothetical protein